MVNRYDFYLVMMLMIWFGIMMIFCIVSFFRLCVIFLLVNVVFFMVF